MEALQFLKHVRINWGGRDVVLELERLMSWDAVSDSVCDIARALSIVGDRWTLLIMREIRMGSHFFEEIQAQTGMSSHLLSLRLKRLQASGVIDRRLFSTRPDRFGYYATDKGKELDPILLALRSWGLKWENETKGRPALTLLHKQSGEVINATWQAPLGKLFSFDDTEQTVTKGFRAERDAKRESFVSSKPSRSKKQKETTQ